MISDVVAVMVRFLTGCYFLLYLGNVSVQFVLHSLLVSIVLTFFYSKQINVHHSFIYCVLIGVYCELIQDSFNIEPIHIKKKWNRCF